MLCCSTMSLEPMTENMASVLGAFIKWNSRKTIKREEALARVLFESAVVLITS